MRYFFITMALLLWCFICQPSLATSLPGPADAGRIDVERKRIIPQKPFKDLQPIEKKLYQTKIPEGAEKITFTLKEVIIEGATAFSKSDMEDFYIDYVSKEISLKKLWEIADEITSYYQNQGYFISRAYIPEQKVMSGKVRIRVVEGYIGDIEFNQKSSELKNLVNNFVIKIKTEKPARIETVESFLLRLNDLSGFTFRSIIEPADNETGNEDFVKLVIKEGKKKDQKIVNFDNYNSRYLGPYETSFAMKTSFVPLQETDIIAISSLPADKLKNILISHRINLSFGTSMEIYASYTDSNPEYILRDSNIESDVFGFGISISEQIIRQRQENLSVKFSFDSKENFSDIFNQKLTRDHVRAARLGVFYDVADKFSGYNFINATFSHGLNIFDASSENDPFISRAGAEPDFSKAELFITRFLPLAEDFVAVTSASGQISSSVLYSSEQFGYGGQSFGRAYDASEIIGDEGIAGLFELQYGGLASWYGISFLPYVYYDIGKIWNKGLESESGSSGGIGFRFDSEHGMSGNILVAQPLTRDQETPLYGNGKNPRLLFRILYKF